ncbi:MAG: nucleoid-structuring protein H-NS, partial [Planctomycetes bacterium]|nr:nucleoid-structuring protein H-NS [Planctomycetota bacterium]
MYREEIKVLDCTIRDGGLINNHHFTDEFVRAVYKSLTEAGIDYIEMGYRSSRKYAPPEEFGAWKYCDDEKIRHVIDGIESDVKISIMVDAHRVAEQEFVPVDQSPVDMIRVASYAKDVDKAIAMVNRCHDLGYETTVNVMAISAEGEFELVEALDQLAK